MAVASSGVPRERGGQSRGVPAAASVVPEYKRGSPRRSPGGAQGGEQRGTPGGYQGQPRVSQGQPWGGPKGAASLPPPPAAHVPRAGVPSSQAWPALPLPPGWLGAAASPVPCPLRRCPTVQTRDTPWPQGSFNGVTGTGQGTTTVLPARGGGVPLVSLLLGQHPPSVLLPG